MSAIAGLIDEFCNEAKINLRLLDGNHNVIFDNLPSVESNITRKIKVNDRAYKIILDQDNIKIIPIIEYLLNKLSIDSNIIEEIIEGKKQWDSLEINSILNGKNMILIESSNKNETFEIVKNTYDSDEVYVGEVYDRIIVVGELEEVLDHALSLKETIDQIVGAKSKISVANFDSSFEGFNKAYKNNLIALKIGDKFQIKPEIYNIEEMYLERAIFNLSKEYIGELKEEYKDIFSGFNHELIQTLEEVLKCDLSLTKASKKLFVHRNTLMYRIEKIKKETGFDIRNFKEATFLYILYMNSK